MVVKIKQQILKKVKGIKVFNLKKIKVLVMQGSTEPTKLNMICYVILTLMFLFLKTQLKN